MNFSTSVTNQRILLNNLVRGVDINLWIFAGVTLPEYLLVLYPESDQKRE